MKSGELDSRQTGGLLPARAVEIVAGLLLALYVLAVVVSIVARLSVTDDVVVTFQQTDGIGELHDVSRRGTAPGWDAATYVATLAGSFLLAAAAAFTYRALGRREPALAITGSMMFLGAAFFAGASAIIGLTLAQDFYSPAADEIRLTSLDWLYLMESALEPLRALFGEVSFTFSALGSLAYGGLLAGSRGGARWLNRLGWLGIAAGLLMFFIWFEDSGALHRAGGGAYLLWLALLALRLLIKGTSSSTQQPPITEETN